MDYLWLVVTGTCFIFPYIENFIIPIDELIFFNRVETTNQIYMDMFRLKYHESTAFLYMFVLTLVIRRRRCQILGPDHTSSRGGQAPRCWKDPGNCCSSPVVYLCLFPNLTQAYETHRNTRRSACPTVWLHPIVMLAKQ